MQNQGLNSGDIRLRVVSPDVPNVEQCTNEQIVAINVGGRRYQTSNSTLKNIPNTRLYTITVQTEDWIAEGKEHFFDRNPLLFDYILDYYRTGDLHLPKGVCTVAIKSELDYWGLSESCISPCCWQTYAKSSGQLQKYQTLNDEFMRMNNGNQRADVEDTQQRYWMNKLWSFLEDAGSSKPAKIYAIVTSLLILLNVFTYMLGTLPAFRVDIPRYNDSATNTSVTTKNNSTSTVSNSAKHAKLERLMTSREHPAIFYFDFVCLLFFILEFIFRLVSCPSKRKFAKSAQAISDLLYIVPLTILHVLLWTDRTIWTKRENTPGLLVLQGFIAFRVCRLFLIARNYRPFVILVLSLKASARELLLVVILLLLALVFFSNAIYLAEITNDDMFSDVFQGLWWSLITITTVGYGDIYPVSSIGYVVGSLCAISGLILISLPIPVIAKNFNIYYSFKRQPVSGTGAVLQGMLSKCGTGDTSASHTNGVRNNNINRETQVHKGVVITNFRPV